MERFADTLATLFTFLIFLFLILAPMLMAFLRGKVKNGAGKKKSSRGTSLFEALRREDRVSEPEVEFSQPSPDEKAQPKTPSKPPPREPEAARMHFNEVDAAFEKPLSEKFNALDEAERYEEGAAAARGEYPPADSQRSFSRKLSRLPELKKAVVMSEILGPPKGLGE